MLVRKGPNDQVLTFLSKRDENDPDWQGCWHAPGSAFRPGESENDPAQRVAKEYGVPQEDDVRKIAFRYVGEYSTWVCPTAVERGSGLSRIYLVDLGDYEPEVVEGKRGWFSVYDLPQPMVGPHEKVFIPMAVQAFYAPSNIRIRFVVGGRDFEAVGFLNHYEGSVDGLEMFNRTYGENDGPIRNADCNFLWERRNQWPAILQGFRLVTNHYYIADDPRGKNRFVYSDGQWGQDRAHISGQFDKSNLVLRRCE